jgi:hypothetical protein
VWPDRYEERLAQWRQLRDANQDNPLEQALLTINDWWQSAPVVNHYLHWDDLTEWPDPWQLLADNHFCSLAKALGIVYTIQMTGRSDVTSMYIADNGDSGDNLVLVNEGKYILNWAPGELLNITSKQVSIKRSIDSKVVVKKIN